MTTGHGCHCKTTRLWWTSSWRSFRIHAGKKQGRSQHGSDFRSQHVLIYGSYFTLQMTEIFVEHWRSSGSSWTKCVRTPTCWIIEGKTVRRSSVGIRMKKKPNWGCPFVQRTQGLCLSVYVKDIRMAGTKQNRTLKWEKLIRNVDLDEPTSFLDHVYWGWTQRECKSNETIWEKYREMLNHVFLLEHLTNYPGGEKNSRKNSCVVLRHGRTCSENALRYIAGWQIWRRSNCTKF